MSPIRIIAVALAVVALAPACGTKANTTDIIEAGQVDIKLPPGWKVVDGKAVRPSGAAASRATSTDSVAPGGSTGDTIPLAQDDPTTKFFKATGAFQTCLKANNTKFIGAPDQSHPDSPVNNPDYIKALSTCAASSKIVQALSEMNAAQDKLTPAEIKTQNEQYLKWRTCMIGRGWDIGTPTPDAKGRLFTFSASSQPKITPPAGKDLLSSPDLRECANKAQGKSS